jgi:hypothetical protein
MHVGMQGEILSPRVENAEETDLGAPVPGIGGEFEHGFRAGTKQQVVDHLGVPLTQGLEFLGEGKDYVEVGDTEQFLFSRDEPALRCLGLALGTVPIAA